MRFVFEAHGERLEVELADDRLLGAWSGPGALTAAELPGRIDAVLDQPLDFPSLARTVVPGDRVVIALDPATPGWPGLVAACCQALRGAGVEPADILVVAAERPAGPETAPDLPEGVGWAVHDPDDRAGLAYLASTPEGRRIYLNRQAVDADVVVGVGRVAFDPALGVRGPWSTIFPGLSDAPTRQALREPKIADGSEPAALRESAGVSWLLGSRFQIGVIAGATGVADVVAGDEPAVEREARRRLETAWTFRPAERAEVVVASIGEPGQPIGWDDLIAGLEAAAALVQRGGKLVVLAPIAEAPGPAVRQLSESDDPRAARDALRGAERAEDFALARQLARIIDWADLYLWSKLPDDLLEGLTITALRRPSDARRLVESGASCLFVQRAELTRVERAPER
jgi:nickel-dependent lactate racemase